MSHDRDLLWNLIEERLLDDAWKPPRFLLDRFFSGDLDLPEKLERETLAYLTRSDSDSFDSLASEVVNSFYLSGYFPEGHLLTTAYLTLTSSLTAREACRLVQLDGGNFSLISEEAKDLVRLAETIGEEELIGVRLIDDDDVLATSLRNYFNAWKQKYRGELTAENQDKRERGN